MKPKYKIKDIYKLMGSLHLARLAVSEGSFDDAFKEPFDKDEFERIAVSNMKAMTAMSVKYLTDEESQKINDATTKQVIAVLQQMGMKMNSDMFNEESVQAAREDNKKRETERDS